MDGGGGHGSFAQEACDGTNLLGMSCKSLGFLSGTLACAANCTFDFSRCDECSASDPSVISCGTAPVSPNDPTALGIAATDAEVGVAWVGNNAAGASPGLRFARLSSDLNIVKASDLDGDADASYLSVAPLPSGWVVAASSLAGATISIHALDAAGSPTGTTTVDTFTRRGFAPAGQAFAARSNGGPLLVWSTSEALRAAVVSADGLSTTPPIDLAASPAFDVWDVSAAFVGDSFYVATTGRDRELRLMRIAPDGNLVSSINTLAGGATKPSIVAGAADLQITYVNDDTFEVTWMHLDADGLPTSPPLPLTPPNAGYGDPSPAIAFGGDTAVLLPRAASWRALGLARVTSAGQIGAPLHEFAQGQDLWPHFLARRGPDAIVAWLGHGGGCSGGRIGIARLTP